MKAVKSFWKHLKRGDLKTILFIIYNNYISLILYKWYLGYIAKVRFFFVKVFSDKFHYITVALPQYRITNSNWGDDASLVLAELISGRKSIPYKHSIEKAKNFLCIGSIINWYSNHEGVVWGSGIISTTIPIVAPPKMVKAVRGPLTRDFLLKNNIECPEIYGDPALLFPFLYKPEHKKIYKLGVIGHHSEIHSLEFKKMIKGLGNDILFIDIVNYGKWSDFIDKVLSCEVIASSSLHGIIISDAYKIPNVWMQFVFIVQDDAFKFKDYFYSVNKDLPNLFVFNSDTALNDIFEAASKWQEPNIDLEPLINACPFLEDKNVFNTKNYKL